MAWMTSNQNGGLGMMDASIPENLHAWGSLLVPACAMVRTVLIPLPKSFFYPLLQIRNPRDFLLTLLRLFYRQKSRHAGVPDHTCTLGIELQL